LSKLWAEKADATIRLSLICRATEFSTPGGAEAAVGGALRRAGLSGHHIRHPLPMPASAGRCLKPIASSPDTSDAAVAKAFAVIPFETIATKVCPLYLFTGEYDFSCTPEDARQTAAARGRKSHDHGTVRSFPDEREPKQFRRSIAPVLGHSDTIEPIQMRSTRMKRILSLGFALAAALSANPAGAQELTGTLKNIKETGAITLGHRDSSIPFSYLDDNQKPIGYAMDICYKVVDAVKKELKLDRLDVKLNPVTSSTRIPLLANGTIDLECGSTTNNTERQKQIAYTNTHFLTASRFVSKKSSKINSIDDLKGKSVVSTAGTTNIKQLTEANAARNLKLNIIPAKDHAEAFLMVETDRAVAFVMDDILLASLAAGSKSPDDYVISKDAFSKPEPYGIMLRKDDPAFKKVVDAATAQLYTSGEGKKIYDKWFTQKIPPKGLNLNTPMSPELTNQFAKPSDSPDPDSYK
jgi:glutamate/aspartate transport system substrate-binding protein